MFGIKIISKSYYEFLLNEAAKVPVGEVVGANKYKQLEKDCESLREQLDEKTMELAKLRNCKKLRFDDLFEFHVDLPHCSECPKEQPDCKKFSVGSHTVCITNKPSFLKKSKK
jgi:hypothetical protein